MNTYFNSVINDNNLNILKNIKSKSINLILTDPPYQISQKSNFSLTENTKYINHHIDYGDWDKIELDWNYYLSEFFRVLKDGGQVIIFYDIFKLGELKTIADELGFKQPRVGIWKKTNPTPINSKANYLSNAKEYFISFVKKGKATFNSKYDDGVYNIPTIAGREVAGHPTQKPIKLMKELVLKHSNEGDIILDPFCGSGTTLVAAKELNRNWIGIDNNKEYIDICNSRLNIYPDEIKEV